MPPGNPGTLNGAELVPITGEATADIVRITANFGGGAYKQSSLTVN